MSRLTTKQFVINHTAIGTRRGGSWNGDEAGLLKELESDPKFQKWAASAGNRDDYPLFGGLYVTCFTAEEDAIIGG